MLYGETGTSKLEVTVYYNMINFWCRLFTNSHNKLSFIMYKLLLQMHEDDSSTFTSLWILKIKSILNNCGMSYVWLNQDTINTKNCNNLKHNLKTTLYDSFVQNWKSEIHNNTACIIYRIFKDEHNLELYLSSLEPRYRVYLCKFRCRSHNLPCNKDRFNISDPDDLCCEICNTRGDEFHYIFVCPKFVNERRKYLPKYYTTRPNILKMNELFKSRKIKVLRNLSIYCKCIMDNFKQ